MNWGFHAEGQGEAVLVASDVGDWNLLIEQVLLDEEKMDLSDQFRSDIAPFAYNNRIVPFSVKQAILMHLSGFSKQALILEEIAVNEHGQEVPKYHDWVSDDVIYDCNNCRDWKPEDCTIDLAWW